MIKMQKLARLLYVCLAILVFGSCKETEYILPPEVKIQTPEFGLSVALGESVDISAEVKNVPAEAFYQWSVNGIKVSTERVLHFEGIEPGNNTVKLTVSTDNGTATDAVNVLVARGEIDATISVVGDRQPEIEYLDSLVLRGNVFCREEYEVEWIVDDQRVSKEAYYVFKALKEGIHTVTFKALDVNGKFVTDQIDIKVNVPVLDAVIEEPEFGFRTPMGTPLTLHGEANRVSDLAWEWSVNGQVVGTEQDYTLPADNLDLVEVTLKVTDPTQTASTKVTIDIHNATQYGTYVVAKDNIHFIDYAGRTYKNLYTEANPDITSANFSGPSAYDDKYFVVQTKKNYVHPSGNLWDTKIEFTVIDLKTLHVVRTIESYFTGSTNGNSPEGILTLVNGKMFYVVKTEAEEDRTIEEDGIYEIDLMTGERKLFYSLVDKNPVRLFSYNGNIYLFFTPSTSTSPYLVGINSSTGEVVKPAAYNSMYYYMEKRSYYTVTKDGLYKNVSGYAYFDDLNGSRTTILYDNKSPRLDFQNLCEYNGYIYACYNGFLGRIKKLDNVDSNSVTIPFEYIADLGSHPEFSGLILSDVRENLKITSDGILLINWQTGQKIKVGIFSIKNPDKLINVLELTGLLQYVYQFIEIK